MKELLTHHAPTQNDDRAAPEPDWVRGDCPCCGGPVVSNAYRVGGKGYIIVWECWASLDTPERRTCDYRRVI